MNIAVLLLLMSLLFPAPQSNAREIQQTGIQAVNFHNGLYLDNTTYFTANFTDQSPTRGPGYPPIIFNLTVDAVTPVIHLARAADEYLPCCGNGTEAMFSITLSSQSVPEGRYNYFFQIGNWKSSANRTLDVVFYYHLLFIDYLGTAEDALQNARSSGVPDADAQTQYDLAKSYADQREWKLAYNALLPVQTMVDADFQAKINSNIDTAILVLGLAFGSGFLIFGYYRYNRWKKRKEKRSR